MEQQINQLKKLQKEKRLQIELAEMELTDYDCVLFVLEGHDPIDYKISRMKAIQMGTTSDRLYNELSLIILKLEEVRDELYNLVGC